MTIEFFKMDHVFIRIWHGSGEGESSSELDIIWHEIILAVLKYVMFRGSHALDDWDLGKTKMSWYRLPVEPHVRSTFFCY